MWKGITSAIVLPFYLTKKVSGWQYASEAPKHKRRLLTPPIEVGLSLKAT